MAVLFPPAVSAQQLQVLTKNNTRITATFPDETVKWNTISKTGTVSELDIPVENIKTLTLVVKPDGALLAKFRQNVVRLGDADYLTRQNAETTLEKLGGGFAELLQLHVESPSMEVKYRVDRLLKSFANKPHVSLKLDQLVLTDGTTLEGEAPQFSLDGLYRDKPVSFNRSTIVGLEAVDRDSTPPQKLVELGKPPHRVETRMFHRFEDFIEPTQKQFRFETDTNGKPFRDRANIDLAFAKDGLLFRNEEAGYVGISVFSFRFDAIPQVGGKSVCLYGQGRRGKQFEGFVEIRFCEPGKPDAPAGVKQIGTFIAHVKHSRDIVMEAYNAAGQVLATVESTDQTCVFAGVKSNELITRVRIFSNPWLEKVSREIDTNFAIDTLCMSSPIPVQTSFTPTVRGSSVELKNGDRFRIGSIVATDEGNLRLLTIGITPRPTDFIIPQNEFKSIRLAPRGQAANSWQALLSDNSVINVKPGPILTSKTLGQTFKAEEVVALWPGLSKPRLPANGDWKDDGALVVFPTCRIESAPIQYNPRHVSWSVRNKLEQNLFLGREDPSDQRNQEDPTPTETTMLYDAPPNGKGAQRPTFWNSPPTTSQGLNGAGVIELTDGQRFVIGPQNGMDLVAFRQRTVILKTANEKKITIPFNNIKLISFPEP